MKKNESETMKVLIDWNELSSQIVSPSRNELAVERAPYFTNESRSSKVSIYMNESM